MDNISTEELDVSLSTDNDAELEPSAVDRRPRNALLHLIHISAHAIANAGLVFIGYGTTVRITGVYWTPLEAYVRPAAAGLTLFGLVITAASIYVPWYPEDPLPISRVFTAPAAFALVLAAAIAEYLWGLPDSVINGFALLTIAGAIFRMFPRPDMHSSIASRGS